MSFPKKSNNTELWKHMTKLAIPIDGKNTECNRCKKRFVYHTTTCNLWSHLLNKHGISNPSSTYAKNVNAAEKRLQNQPTVDAMMQPVQKYKPQSARHQDITHLLAKHLFIEMIPVNKVESLSWRALTSLLDPRYVWPNINSYFTILSYSYLKIQFFKSNLVEIWII